MWLNQTKQALSNFRICYVLKYYYMDLNYSLHCVCVLQ